MQELSRIRIEEYCWTHQSKRSDHIWNLLELSYSVDSELTDADAIFLERAIESEKNPELKEALEDLNDFLFGW